MIIYPDSGKYQFHLWFDDKVVTQVDILRQKIRDSEVTLERRYQHYVVNVLSIGIYVYYEQEYVPCDCRCTYSYLIDILNATFV